MRIVVDSSALVAILLGEPERTRFHQVLLSSDPLISIVTAIEVYSVAFARLGPAAIARVDRQFANYKIEIRAVEPADFSTLKQAMLDFGKGRRRAPAVLNFGDLFAYALAKRLALPLLFKGDDFARTDVQRVPV
jgi:ribonuclease VapC